MAIDSKNFSKGDVIFREGDAGSDVYLIIEGKVSLSKNTARGSVEIEVLEAGASFGETGVMNGGKRTLTAVAVGSVQLQIMLDANTLENTTNNAATDTNHAGLKQEPPKQIGSPPHQSWWSRLLHPGGTNSSDIEVRIVLFSGEGGTTQAKKIQSALQHCAGIKAKLVSREGPFIQKNGISKNNIGVCVGAARKILKNTGGDILIWGEIPSFVQPDNQSSAMKKALSTDPTMHLHFISAVANNEDFAGSYNGYDVLPLPLDLDEGWTSMLYGVVLSAMSPSSVAKLNNINQHIEQAIEQGAIPAQSPPQSFSAVERANLLVCLANSIVVVARRMNESDLLGFAADTYSRALELITFEDHPVVWGMAHKQRGSVQMMIAERLGDPSALNEAQNSLETAVDTIPRRLLPREWAAAQNKLGLVYYKLDYADPSSDLSRLNLAITAFQAAIQVYSRVDVPQRWADVMNNFAQAAQVMGQQSMDPEMLQKAVSACRSALEVRSRTGTPMLWAASQNTLGSALFLLGKHVERIDHLEASMDAFHAAYTIYAARDARKMMHVISRNLERVRVLLAELRADNVGHVQWFEETESQEISIANIEKSREESQWWKDNVVDGGANNHANQEYHHPAATMDRDGFKKTSNAAE